MDDQTVTTGQPAEYNSEYIIPTTVHIPKPLLAGVDCRTRALRITRINRRGHLQRSHGWTSDRVPPFSRLRSVSGLRRTPPSGRRENWRSRAGVIEPAQLIPDSVHERLSQISSAARHRTTRPHTVTYYVVLPLTLRASVDAEHIAFGRLARFRADLEGAADPSALAGAIELHADDDRDGVFERLVGRRVLRPSAAEPGTASVAVLVASLKPGNQFVRVSYSGDTVHSATPTLVAIDVAEPPPTVVWGWGRNNLAQLADGEGTNDRLSPVMSLAGAATAVAAGTFHSLAIRPDGTVAAWGNNAHGEAGVPGSVTVMVPVQVPDVSGVVAVDAGGSFSLAVDEARDVWMWGLLAPGSSVRLPPTRVMADAVAIAAGWAHALTLRADGTVWAWGRNGDGQLGDGTLIERVAPVKVHGISNAVAVATGPTYSAALDADGNVWIWGSGYLGQPVGRQSRSDAVRVSLSHPIRTISSGNNHMLALAEDGTLWAWGLNDYGVLGLGNGLGNGDDQAVPARVPLPEAVHSIGAGLIHSLAITASGQLWAWGYGEFGAVGDGTGETRLSPVRVQIRRATAVTSGSSSWHSLVLVDPRDLDAPVTTAVLNVAADRWTNSSVVVDLSATDTESGVASITYSATGAQAIAQTTVSGSVARLEISAEGVTTIAFHAVDRDGNVETARETVVRIDTTPPEITVDSPTNGALYELDAVVAAAYSCSDPLSGLVQCAAHTENGAPLFSGTPGSMRSSSAPSTPRAMPRRGASSTRSRKPRRRS